MHILPTCFCRAVHCTHSLTHTLTALISACTTVVVIEDRITVSGHLSQSRRKSLWVILVFFKASSSIPLQKVCLHSMNFFVVVGILSLWEAGSVLGFASHYNRDTKCPSPLSVFYGWKYFCQKSWVTCIFLLNVRMRNTLYYTRMLCSPSKFFIADHLLLGDVYKEVVISNHLGTVLKYFMCCIWNYQNLPYLRLISADTLKVYKSCILKDWIYRK